MSTPIRGRSGNDHDKVAIADVVRRAYANVGWSEHREHLMVDRLRLSEDFLPMLSLVADVDGEAVGHLLLTRAWIGAGTAATATLALAPLSVLPERQGRGIGSALIHKAHNRALRLGFEIVLCVGSPTYYPRFVYQPLAAHPIMPPFEAPAENQMILPLVSGALHGVEGVVRYSKGWLAY